MHPSRHVKSGFLDLSFIFLNFPLHPTTKNKKLSLENLPGAVHNFASLLFELFNLFSIYLIPLDLLSVPVFFKSAHRVMV